MATLTTNIAFDMSRADALGWFDYTGLLSPDLGVTLNNTLTGNGSVLADVAYNGILPINLGVVNLAADYTAFWTSDPLGVTPFTHMAQVDSSGVTQITLDGFSISQTALDGMLGSSTNIRALFPTLLAGDDSIKGSDFDDILSTVNYS